jgi:DNA-binding Xre family transcriptional regulator
MKIRLKISEAVAKWNSGKSPETPKKTMKSLASEALTENIGGIGSKYNMIKRMNAGQAIAVKLIDIVNICYALDSTPNDLIDWKC